MSMSDGPLTDSLVTHSDLRTSHSVEITEIYSHTFCQKFRESNVFRIPRKEITKVAILRNNFSVRVNYSFFHTVCVRASHKSLNPIVMIIRAKFEPKKLCHNFANTLTFFAI